VTFAAGLLVGVALVAAIDGALGSLLGGIAAVIASVTGLVVALTDRSHRQANSTTGRTEVEAWHTLTTALADERRENRELRAELDRHHRR
jgi:hypothetical protein